MNIADSIKRFLKKFLKQEKQISDESTPNEDDKMEEENVKVEEYVGIYDIPNYASYKERVNALILLAEQKDGIFEYKYPAYEKMVLGAVLEEKGASSDLMNIYTNCNVDVLSDPILLNGTKIDEFVIPKIKFKYTADGIKRLMNEYRKIVNISSDGNTYIIQWNGTMESGSYGENNIYQSTQYDYQSTQCVKVDGEKRVGYKLNQRQSIYKSNSKQTKEYNKVLKRENGKDMMIEEERTVENGDGNLYYCIKREGEKAVVSIGNSRHSNCVSYRQGAPESLLDQNKGLGFYHENTNAQMLYSGKISVEELEKNVWPNNSYPGLTEELELDKSL